MDDVSVKKDFARFKKTIESLSPVFQDILKHFENVADEHFSGDKRLLLCEKDEEYLQDALSKNCTPIVAFVGSSNSGKSSLLNLIAGKGRIMPVSSQCCTARVVRLKHLKRQGRQSWCLLDSKGNRVSDPKPFKKNIPKGVIDLEDEQREGEEVKQTVECTVESEGILSYGVELIDTPGLGENEALNNILVNAMKNDMRPLIVYVIDGHSFFRKGEADYIDTLEKNYPMAEIIYVVNKSDLEETDASMNCSDEEEDLVDGETGARRGKKTKEMSSTARFGELEVIMNKLKQLKYLDKDNKFNKSENFHCVSSKVVGSAQRKTSKGKPLNDSDVLFLKTYKRFHECLLKRLHQIMRDLEEAVRQRIHNLLHSFLNLLGTNRIGIMKALRDMEDFIASARTAEGYLHDHKRFHKLFDSVLTGGVITGALETAKLEVERFAEEPQELWSLDEISHDPKRWVWLTRFGLRVHMPSESLEEQEVLRTKLKAVSFVIEAERVVVRSISKAVVEHVEEALTANAGEFQKIINAARSKNVEILNRLFDQAYRVQHGKGDFDGVKKMHDIVNWAPIRATIWETMRCYGEEIFHQTKMRHTNFARWRTELINMVFNQFDAEKIGSLLREGCSRRLNEMHQEFVKITSRVKNLRDAVTEKGSESIKVMESTVKPRLLLHVCEVASIEFDRNHQGEFEAGRWIGKDGDFTVHECPANRDWVIYVAKKCDFPGDKEWLKVVEHVFFADEMRKRTCRPHPHLVNCHGFWMPDRETFNVAFDRADVTLTEYLNTKCLPLKERLRLALKIARVLALIHNVVHLCHPDLRISNIMVKEDEPKLLHCCSKSPFEPVMVEKDGKKVQMLPFHLHPDFKSIERSESASYMDCYSYGMLLWLLTKGSPEAYPEVFMAYDAIEKLSGIRQVWDVKIIPEEPDGLPGEEDLVKKLYEIMKLLWTSKDIRMDLVADHLEYLLDMRNDSVLVDCYPQLK